MTSDFATCTTSTAARSGLRDYLYSRLLSGANLSLSDRLTVLMLLSRDSVRTLSSGTACRDASALSPQIIGNLKGYLLNSRGTVPGDVSLPDISPDYLGYALRGRITKINT
jgi:hypothetical protein